MNDDFFFAKDLSVTDFYSSVYGVVLRMDPGLLVAAEERPTDNPAGEWQPLKYSNWLLSERFGYRSRPYMIHVAKTLSPAILSEINSIWPAEFAETASHRFRGQRDVYTTFLHGHYLVERWRELLLWSWCVAKIGKDDDSWEEEDTWRAWEELGGTEYLDVLTVRLALRKTLEKERVERHLQDVGEQPPKATDYVFSSLDGFPYSYVYNRPKGFPNFASGDDDIEAAEAGLTEEWATCQIDRVKCFPAGKSASEIFKHILFTNPKTCGDCVITALINASGRLGLNAFLPPPHRIHYSNSKGRVVKDVDPNSVPRLPLSKRPRDASFKFKDVMRDWETVRVRDWVLRAMERYRFVIGNTPTHFAMLSSPRGAQLMFAKINSIKDLALLTVNDDVRLQEQKVDSLFRAFLDRRWGFPSAWENVVYSS
ncbi:hypothetical protein FRC18_001098 [Serendipita sp. 400]|nr:hypothetical protein FRC18_001098 [Serendipita sp. 400]